MVLLLHPVPKQRAHVQRRRQLLPASEEALSLRYNTSHMTRIDAPASLYIAPSLMPNAGRGVFAKERIPEGAVIERCPVVALHDPKERKRLRKTGLVNYYFLWGDKREFPAICLGWGSIYNHSFTPNARYEKVMDEGRMDFYALRDIEPGEEITVNYNGAPNDTRPLLIPGIPVEEGGMPQSKYPRVIEGIVRRLKLLWKRFET